MSHAPRLRDVLVSLWKALETAISVPKLTGGFCFYIIGPIKRVKRKCLYLRNSWQKAAKQKRILSLDSINLKKKKCFMLKIYSQYNIKLEGTVSIMSQKDIFTYGLNSYYIQSLHIDSVV